MADSVVACWPPSEKLSGVTLTIPMTRGRQHHVRMRSLRCHSNMVAIGRVGRAFETHRTVKRNRRHSVGLEDSTHPTGTRALHGRYGPGCGTHGAGQISIMETIWMAAFCTFSCMAVLMLPPSSGMKLPRD